jgi:hypothetical protein
MEICQVSDTPLRLTCTRMRPKRLLRNRRIWGAVCGLAGTLIQTGHHFLRRRTGLAPNLPTVEARRIEAFHAHDFRTTKRYAASRSGEKRSV